MDHYFGGSGADFYRTGEKEMGSQGVGISIIECGTGSSYSDNGIAGWCFKS
jgi:hypothetical protein